MSENSDFVRQIQQNSLKQRVPFWIKVRVDPWLLVLLLTLTTLGLFVLYSASEAGLPAVKRQAVYFILGYMVMLVMAQIPMLFYRRITISLYFVGLILLVLVLINGIGAKGAKRWLVIPGVMSFQPSELLKLAVPMMMAWFLAKKRLPPRFGVILISLLLIFLPAGLIGLQPDLGTAILIASSGLFVLFLSGINYWYISFSLVGIVSAAYPIWEFILRDYQKGRILTLFNPERDPFGAGWNIIQSKTAIGSGGFWGKGWLQGTQSQLNFLPESHTDFIIATYSEEFGLLGVMLLLTLYFLIIARCLIIAWVASTHFNKLLAGSLTLTFFVYIFVNMGMVSGILPVVGVPLPLISRGGTSIVTLMAGFGLLMAIAADKQQFSR